MTGPGRGVERGLFRNGGNDMTGRRGKGKAESFHFFSNEIKGGKEGAAVVEGKERGTKLVGSEVLGGEDVLGIEVEMVGEEMDGVGRTSNGVKGSGMEKLGNEGAKAASCSDDEDGAGAREEVGCSIGGKSDEGNGSSFGEGKMRGFE